MPCEAAVIEALAEEDDICYCVVDCQDDLIGVIMCF